MDRHEDQADDVLLDPETRYGIFKKFDFDSYDDDLKEFPDFFDNNGWPLFGEYDPYSLKHPITDLSWHIEPRTPSSKETWPEYERWFYLATIYNSERYEIGTANRKIQSDKLDDPGTSDSVYVGTSLKAPRGNLNYLRKHIIPKLDLLFSQRNQSLEFAELWGEFRSIVAIIKLSTDQTIRKKKAGDSQKRDAQIKWYIHFRRYYCDENGWTLKDANHRLKQLIFNIVEGKIPPPSEFSIERFQHACRKQKGEKDKFDWGFTEALNKANSHKKKAQFLASPANEEPKIPPIDLDLYK